MCDSFADLGLLQEALIFVIAEFVNFITKKDVYFGLELLEVFHLLLQGLLLLLIVLLGDHMLLEPVDGHLLSNLLLFGTL
jgi:hypothetical protein